MSDIEKNKNAMEVVPRCNSEVIAEPCPTENDIAITGCNDTIEYDAGDLEMESQGRILMVDVTIKKVCPNRRVALAAILHEVDPLGNEHKRGLKTVTIPAHTSSRCQDITVRCIKFVLPEDLDVSGTAGSICNTRNFKAKMIAHYIDNDFDCCENDAVQMTVESVKNNTPKTVSITV